VRQPLIDSASLIPLRRSLLATRVAVRAPTSSLRLLPDFLIIGTQRGGTTSLYQYIAMHPDVAVPIKKEIQYFTLHYGRGESWYRSHFPTALGNSTRRRKLTFEATPYYLLHPHTPTRVAETLPDTRIIVLLRDPVLRAFSHYRHTRERNLEPLSFEAAIEAEPRRLAGIGDRMERDPTLNSRSHQLFSYVTRGIYVDQLRRWMDVFPKDRLLVLRSEDLYRNTSGIYAEVLEFLHLRSLDLGFYPAFTERRSDNPKIPPVAKAHLRELFAPHNARLASLLGRDMAWDG